MTIERPTEFQTWTEYFGPVAQAVDNINGLERTSTIYGWENFSERHQTNCYASIVAQKGAVFGYVTAGSVKFHDKYAETTGTTIKQGRYFCLPAPVGFELAPFTRIIAIHTYPFQPLRMAVGGPIESKGRLRYIDGCSDSLLIGPPKIGDPCMNLLHFPPGINQTAHTHPSVRCGAIASGGGYCMDGEGNKLDLLPGMIWMIPTGFVHSFHTAESDDNLNVIAFHPDSDHGPDDENHPMLNRTWVDGTKVDNTTAEHDNPDIMKFSYDN